MKALSAITILFHDDDEIVDAIGNLIDRSISQRAFFFFSVYLAHSSSMDSHQSKANRREDRLGRFDLCLG